MKQFFTIIFTIILLFSSQNIFAAERKVENNYHFTNYFQSMEDLYKYRKSIVIDTKHANLKAYFYWQEIWSFDASVWNRNWPTPHWRFRIVNKNPMMQAKRSWLYMPNWMEFRWHWTYWIHGFPLYKNFSPKYPDEQKFSKTKLWWWCVRIEKENLNLLYNWVELLTTVIVL